MALADEDFSAVGLVGAAAGDEFAVVSTEAHRAAHLGDGLLLLHEVDDVVGRVGVHLAAVGVGIAENVAGKLDDHHLHAEADTEGGQVVGAAILGGEDFALSATLAKAGTDDEAGHAAELVGDVVGGEVLAVDEVGLHLAVVVSAGVGKTFKDTLVGVLQVVLADEGDVDDFGGLLAAFEEVAPRTEFGSRANSCTHLFQTDGVEALMLHADGHFIDTGQVLALDDGFDIDVTEVGDLGAQIVTQRVLGAQDEDFGLYAEALQLLDAGLRGFRLQFASGSEVRHVSEVYVEGTGRAKLPAQLADGFEERLALDIADGAADFGNDDFGGFVARLALAEAYAPLDFVGDVRDDLYGLAEVVATAFALDDTEVDAPRGDTVVARGFYACEAFIVSQVEVGFLPVGSDVALAVLIGVERTGVNVDVGVKLLDGDFVAAGLQQFAERGRDNALAQ